MLRQLNLLLKLLIVVGYYVLWRTLDLLKLLNLWLKMLIVVGYIMCSSFIEAVESVVENVDCCRLYYVL